MGIFGKSKDGKVHTHGGLVVSKTAAKDERLGSDFILGAIADGVVVSRANVIEVFNPAAATITGWPAEEAVGLDYRNVLVMADERGEKKPDDSHPFTQALNSGKTVRLNSAWITNRGNKRVPISLIVSPVLDAAGAPSGTVVGVFRDITSQHEEEKQRSEFISTASHEMRTPLTAIEGYLALALNEKIAKLDENGRKYVEKASRATKDLSVLFADLLTSSKAEDGRLVSYPTVVEIGEAVENIVEDAKIRAKEKNLELNFSVSTNTVTGAKVVRPLFYAHVDPHRIAEVLQNLIDNAIKYTSTGSITVRLTGNNEIIQIQVEDTGEGIPEEDIPHLFQKFYRVDSSMTRTVGGTGLGLYICKKIIELYNGQIWVESRIGKGSTFFINLPRLTPEKALEIQKSQSITVSPLDPVR